MDYVGSPQTFSVRVWNSREEPLDSGHRVDFTLTGSATVRRLNKLRRQRDDAVVHQELYSDGTTLTLSNPREGVYATGAYAGTIDTMSRLPRSSLLFEQQSATAAQQSATTTAVIGTIALRSRATRWCM